MGKGFVLIFVMMTLCLVSLFAQKRTIHGKVVTATTLQPVASASVIVTNATKVGTLTDNEGYFTIQVPAGDSIVIAAVGYQRQAVQVTNQDTIFIKLAESKVALNDVLVTALGITKAKRSVGYSVAEVSGASLTEARENSFVNALEGKVAGVNVSGVAAGPNSASNVIIRGFTSLTGDNQPLYVVNGVPLINNNYATSDVQEGYGGKDGGDGIGDINPDDIENISILKGAAATALYGYRGEKGVVLITTKKGKTGNGIGVEINSNDVLQRVIDYTDFQTVYGQGYNGAKPIDGPDALGSMESSWGAKLDGSSTPQFDGVSRPYSSAAKGNLSRFYKNGNTITNSVAFSKGFGDAGSTRFSVSRMDNNSYVPNAGLQRMTFTQTTNLNLDKHLKLDLSSQYITEYTKNAPNLADAIGNLNWGPMFLPPNINIKTLAGPNGNGTQVNGDELNPFADPYTTNPYFAAYKFIGAIHRNRFIGSADLKYTFDNGLFLSAQVAEDYMNDRNTNIEPIGTGYLVDNDVNGDMTEQNVKQTELNIDLTAGKNFNLAKDLKLNVLIGGNHRKSQQEYLGTYGQNFNIPFLYIISNLADLTASYSLQHTEYWSAYGTADLAYKNYAYLTVTGRNDWYSTLAPGKTNYLYPSVSGSFVFSELWHIPGMNMGRIRLSYAAVGGDASDNPYGTLQGYGNSGTLEIPNGVYPIGFAGKSQVPNSDLIPSSRKEFEIGAEMDFFQDRLKFDVAAYRKKVINDIVPVSIDLTSGYTGALLNVGNLRYDGLEFTLGGAPISGRNFSWNIDFNASYTSGKVLYLGNQDHIDLGIPADDWGSAAVIRQVVGKAPNQIFANYPETDENGKIVIDPTYDAPNPNSADLKDFGTAISPWTGGITNTLKYKHLSLSFLVDGKFGGKLFSTTNLVAYTQGLSKLTLAGRDKTYGTEQDAPSQYYGNWASADQGMFVYDASFLKLRQIILGYDLPASMFHNKIQGIRISFVMRNVLTLVKHTPNIDPETSYSASIWSQGLEAPSVPYSRTFGFNVNVKF